MISATAGSFNTVVPTETELGTEQGGDQEGPGGDASIAPRNVYALTFLAPLTGTYLVQVNFDQNNSGARGGRGVFFDEDSDYVAFRSRLFLFEAPFTQLFNENSGGLGGNAWIDYFMSGEVQLEAGKTYSLVFTSNIYTESNLGQECDVTVSWNVFTVGP
jgi:hypothetical protein